MSGIIDFNTLSRILRRSREETRQCTTAVARYAIESEQLADIGLLIDLNIVELERLECEIVGQSLTRAEMAILRARDWK